MRECGSALFSPLPCFSYSLRRRRRPASSATRVALPGSACGPEMIFTKFRNRADRHLDNSGELHRLGRANVAFRPGRVDHGHRKGKLLPGVERRQIELDRRPARLAPRTSNGWVRRGGGFGGEAEPGRQTAQDGGSRARLGVDYDRAAMQLYEALDERQAKPGARLAGIRVAALEFFEDSF